MTGPVAYELTIPLFRKALQNNLAILCKAEEWCKENGHDLSTIPNATLGDDMMGLSFHVEFCTYNAVQMLIDLGIADVANPEITGEEMKFEQLISRVEEAIKKVEAVSPEKFAGKDEIEVNLSLGPLKLTRPALVYLDEISIPSL